MVAVVGMGSALLAGSSLRAADEGEGLRLFEEKIRPLLSENCFKCHAAKKQKAGLRLDSRARILQGGESGPAIVPGNPGESLMIEAVSYRSSDLEMPPKKKLGKRQVEDLTKWVALGAPWPEGERVAADHGEEEKKFEITEEDRSYWAFQPLRRGPEKHFDEIIEASLTEKKLVLNAAASRAVLIRRAYFDLIGLPPSFAEVQAFVEDADPEAFRKLIDRLLERPEYGERWGRHWLDVVRFAQSNGYERDDEKPQAWRYRDYVIASFNEDKRYDRFILEQLAGDELPEGGDAGWIATGFYRLGVWDDEPDDKRAAEFDGQDDMLKTTTETFLGLTVGCARCHDHMFDPISQRNYYEMLAFFRNVKPYNRPGGDTIRKTGGSDALVVIERGKEPIDTHVLIRGNAGRPADKVEPRFPQILGGGSAMATPTAHSTGRRLAFAKWVARQNNPLTARVMVNRLWHGHFGRGIVATPNDFGRAGHPPSDLVLLDWLANEFVQNGWSIKHMHRVIMRSRAWQRSSSPNSANDSIDPGNLFHWRFNLRRLESEAIRDSILKCAGVLNPERGGRGFFPALAGEVVAGASKPGRNWQWSPPEQQRRRSVYAFVKRTMLYPFFEIFDYTNTEGSLGVRPTTTVAPQALLLLNSEFVADNAARLARAARAEPDPVSAAFRMILSRNPSEEELKLAAEFLADQERKQAELGKRVTFRPEYPPALFKDYQGALPANRFLRGPEQGWEHYKGRWTGGYEGIVNAEIDWPAYALFKVEARDVSVSGRVILDGITERASVLLRVRAEGEVFEGYSVLFDQVKAEVSVRRHRGGKVATLAKCAVEELRMGVLDFAIRLSDGALHVHSGSRELLSLVDPEAVAGAGQVGVSSWGGSVTFDELEIQAEGARYPVAEIDFENSELIGRASPAAGTSPSGWSAYGGRWSVRGDVIGVANERGPKLLWEEIGALGNGDVFEGELRVREGDIAGFILNVREPKVGADNWIGYEVSFYLKEGKLVLGTHQNNWKLLASAPAPIKRGEWQHLKVQVVDGRVKVFFNGRAEPYLDHKMEKPLEDGWAGLRTWGAAVDYRQLKVTRAGKSTTWSAPQKEAPPRRSSRIVLVDQAEQSRERALQEFCSLLLNLNEFVYID